MKFETEHSGNCVIVKFPEATLEAKNSIDFKEAIAQILTEHRHILLDFSNVDFVDSSGCGALLFCKRALAEKEGVLKLCAVSNQLASLFKMIRLDRTIDVFASRTEAIESFGEKG